MSLINKMLQDLDARRSEVAGNDALGMQIRAVPQRRGIHPAWWVCLALAIVSAGLAGWMLLRPAPVAATSPAVAGVPLRLDVRLEPPPADQAAAVPVRGAETPPSVPGASAASAPDAVVPVVQAPAPATPAPAVAPRAAPPEPARPLPIEPVVEPRNPTVSQSPQSVAAPWAEQTGAAPVATGAKQVKELTPPQRAENEYRKALGLLQQGKGTDAAIMLEQSLNLDPHHVGARQALISILLDAARRDEALRLAREGLARDPSQAGLAMIAARIQVERGELQPAVETLEHSLSHASEQPDYLAFLAALQQRAERHKQAVELYVKALQRSPQNGIWWMGMAISLQADQRKAEAAEAFRRAKASGALSPELQAFVDGRLAQLR
ncbi:tetratricopeptide repeat protein [Noviherbaspirillum aridicola]|uniref:MSHA biogenesis protein MshN n=1 Tax=Noviherbaspirillum aridicola TaxID=2849687 RepID=A0ABQ4Q5F8_9BURK|nr:tetratricopeptide repeat protein [Noviherbaspirillum aridicola]GIZ52439.1 hypothetical protein NCCP691_24530 [Noviherbaspirillum aridicola]